MSTDLIELQDFLYALFSALQLGGLLDLAREGSFILLNAVYRIMSMLNMKLEPGRG